ncbi:putative diacylglycerol kinase, catalytic domain, cullin [Rosa chinensis]|uniref:Putative diacylglycerol kinase, catalytic domain, cullin n=1 Tax=Rosa chinensis TaxID=74649 RepID=A0A2P6SM06_ROSCH|nr:putative diacylglycerol kinase, catalytic domain, cullin [Rosa chinensis]
MVRVHFQSFNSCNFDWNSAQFHVLVRRILDKLRAVDSGNGAIDNLNDAIVEEEGDISGLGLERLLARLNRLLSGKGYLIVLDDVWHISEFYSDLGCTFQDRLSYGLPKGSGGAVIVTTRIPEVAEHMVGRNNLITVEPLDTESCWRIFMETIKDNKEVLNISTHETLDKIKNEIKDQCYGLPLAAKELAGIIPKRIREIESNRFLKEMYIPDELLHADLEVEPAVHIPKFPVLVFIDMKNMNNKQLGEKLLDKFRYHLNKKQVFAVLEEKSDTKKKVKAHDPERVLKDVYGTLEKLKRKGYGFADEIQKTMTVIIVGGDSVANWILGVICDLKLPELPSIAPIPLQTISLIGGSISSSFGWFEDREMQFMVAPLHAAIIMQFQDQKSWTSKDLAAAVGVPIDTLNRRINFWISKGILAELLGEDTDDHMFTLMEGMIGSCLCFLFCFVIFYL